MLIQQNRVKRITASGGGSMTVPSGHSYMVKRIEVVASTNDTYLTCRVDQKTVAAYRVKGRGGNHLGTIVSDTLPANIMSFLIQQDINVMIPVAEGQTFAVSRYAETGNVIIIFDDYAAGDVRSDMPNGSDAKEYTFLQYMSSSETPTASGDVTLDTSLSPSEFPDFPAGDVVPAKTDIDLLGLFGTPFHTGAAGPQGSGTTFAKLIKDREVLFDIDRNGIPFDGQLTTATADAYVSNFSLIGPGTLQAADTVAIPQAPPMIFDEPMKFTSGEELLVYLSIVVNTAVEWEETMIDFGCILTVKRQS